MIEREREPDLCGGFAITGQERKVGGRKDLNQKVIGLSFRLENTINYARM